jgi:hypothetical protein
MHRERDVRENIIEGIFNYCTRRCDLCRFREQCTLFLSEREYGDRHPDATWHDQVHDSFAETLRLLQEWCAREGIDFDEIQREAESDETRAEMERAGEAVRADPLQQLASAYSHGALRITDALVAARAEHTWPTEVSLAFDTITWHAGMLSAKVHRALHGFAERGTFGDEDPVQNDWNGSAKLARIIIGESKAAWQIMLGVGGAPDDSPLRELVALLERVDAGLVERFPHAMEFVRPGFDPPVVTQVAPRK